MQSKRPRVLFISKWYINRRDPQLGVFIRKHAAAAALHCDVALMSIYPDREQKNTIEFEEKDEHGIKTLVVYYKQRNTKVGNAFAYVKAASEGLKRIRQTFGDHDITHAYIMARPAFIAYWLKLFRKKPFVISEQWSGYATGKFQQQNFLVKSLYRWVFSQADAVSSVSEFLKEKMKACGLNGTYFITNNIVEIKPLRFKTMPGKNITVVADLVDDIKNISDVIRAMKEVSSLYPGIRLNIIGHGRDEMLLRNLASQLQLLDRVVFFHGVRTNEEVYQSLMDCDFLVMNSRFETFSSICAEALSCGKPVIATRCGGPQEFITEETGILIDTDSSHQLKEAIMKMLESHQSYDPQALQGYADKKFSAENIGSVISSMYRNVL